MLELRQGEGAFAEICLTLGKSFTSGGKRHAYFSASCPAPKGFSKAVFPFAEASVGFEDGPTLRSTLTRTCKARG